MGLSLPAYSTGPYIIVQILTRVPFFQVSSILGTVIQANSKKCACTDMSYRVLLSTMIMFSRAIGTVPCAVLESFLHPCSLLAYKNILTVASMSLKP